MIALDQTRVTLASGIALDVVDLGPRDAPALIFLHGFPESHRTWRHQIAHLATRFRCIAPDQRGYRGSSRPAYLSAYAPAQLIGDVFQLADALGLAQFTVVGHDWGGAIAWGVALLGQHTRVTRLVIANAPHPAVFSRLLWTSAVQRRASQYIRAFRDPAHDAEIRAHGLRPFLTRVLPLGTADPMEPAERALLDRDWADGEAAIAMLNWYRASPIEVPPLDAPYALPADFQPPPVPRLTIPTLVIWAQDDMALPPENCDGLEDWIDDLTLVRVPQCGHFVPWEAPQAVNTALDGFL